MTTHRLRIALARLGATPPRHAAVSGPTGSGVTTFLRELAATARRPGYGFLAIAECQIPTQKTSSADAVAKYLAACLSAAMTDVDPSLSWILAENSLDATVLAGAAAALEDREAKVLLVVDDLDLALEGEGGLAVADLLVAIGATRRVVLAVGSHIPVDERERALRGSAAANRRDLPLAAMFGKPVRLSRDRRHGRGRRES